MGLYWEPCPGGVRLLRLLGDTPCPAVPGTIEGLPVAELGPYCFADRPVRPGARRTGDDTHEITGNFVEEVTLPDTVRVLDSAAFYNCRRLRRVTLGPGVEGFGSDLFTNCRQLQTFRLRAAADAPTGLKKLLGAVSADITVELDGAQLFYPEYSEFLDENTPAHIFNHSIEGEGYRMRQCFTPGGAVDYAAFDASFAQVATNTKYIAVGIINNFVSSLSTISPFFLTSSTINNIISATKVYPTNPLLKTYRYTARSVYNVSLLNRLFIAPSPLYPMNICLNEYGNIISDTIAAITKQDMYFIKFLYSFAFMYFTTNIINSTAIYINV